MNISRTSAFLLAAALAMGSTAAEEELDELRSANLDKTKLWFENIEAQAATNEHWQTLPNILIDSRKKAIFFKAEATGLSANETMEFMLIGQRSGHAYEALAVALAEPAHIAEAIEMLGLPRGLSIDAAALRFWPKGERVHLYFNEYHAADLMLDQRTREPLPRSGFVFTASHTTEIDGKPALSAQVASPFSIAANYNEPRSILDVPIIAPQSAVYSFQVQNPDIRFEEGELLTVRIEAEDRPDGTMRVQDLELHVDLAPQTTSHPAADLRFTLLPREQEKREALLQRAPLETFLVFIRDMAEQQKDPFVEVFVGDELTLLHANSMAHILTSMQDRDGLRVSGSPPGALFYKAFSPDENMRSMENRVAQPWELHLSHDADPRLVHIQEEWTQGELKPKITTHDIVVDQPGNLATIMRELQPDLRAVFIYAPRDMRIDTIMNMVRPFLESHPFIHVFMTPEPPDQTSDVTPATTSE